MRKKRNLVLKKKVSTFVLQVFHTVSPALAFQYVSLQPPDLEGRVPPYTDNLNSWLGQILQVGKQTMKFANKQTNKQAKNKQANNMDQI